MKQKFFAIFAAAALLLGTGSCTDRFDNPAPPTPEAEEDEHVEYAAQEIDPSEFQPIDVSVALLGSLSSYAEDEATRYWFKDVQGQVTDETMVVITDEITADNENAIVEVLSRYGVLLVVDPKEENVRQYAEAMGIDPNADYSKLELIGLTGFGDKFLSYNNGEEEASDDNIAPASIASDDIWDIAPAEYLRLKAFAQWVDRVDKKYTEYQAYLAELEKAIDEAEAAYEAGDKASTRNEETEDDGKAILNILNLPGEDICAHAFGTPKFKSYKNVARDQDEDSCYLSVTCNYHIKPLYQFPSGTTPGADYYIVDASVGWDCTETFVGFKWHTHTSTDRRSYLFFPISCKYWSEPVPTSNNYKVMVTADGELWPGDVPKEKEVTNSRSFNIDGNVSGGINGSKGNEKDNWGSSSSSNIGGNLDLGLGVGANWSKQESFTTTQYEINPYINGATVGHVIAIPGGEDGWRPKLGDPYFEVSGGVNFRKTFPVRESWIWRVSGTRVNTNDNAISIDFAAEPTVAWYSYFLRSHGIDEQLSSATIRAERIAVSAPNRTDAGFLKIQANTVDGNDKLCIFRYSVTDVTNSDPAKHFPVYNRRKTFIEHGKILNLGLPANRTYNIELEMGVSRSKAKKYILKEWEVEGSFATENLPTQQNFDLAE